MRPFVVRRADESATQDPNGKSRFGAVGMRCNHLVAIGIGVLVVGLLSGCREGGFRLTGYQKSGGNWVFVTWNEGSGRVAHTVEGADSETFEIVLKDEYAKDTKSVYFKAKRIEDADPSTFKVETEHPYVYGSDKNRVWLEDIVVRGADPDTFEMLTFPYSRDRSQIYCGTLPMKIQNVDSFEVLDGGSSLRTQFKKGNWLKEQYDEVDVSQDNPLCTGDGWARDDQAYYCGAFEVKDADYGSFTILNRIYSKDKSRVYWHWMPMPQADAKTFQVRDEISGMDKNRTFLGREARRMPRGD